MHKVPSTLEPFAAIPGVLFEIAVRLRNRFYASGLLAPRRLPAPVISIGNITMGGAGKTPLVIYLARTLAELGFNPVVLSRGYGRERPNESHVLVPGHSIPNAASLIGDEPALIRRHVPDAWMGISKNRIATGHSIAKQLKRPAFILDDGFQHRRLYRDLDIVVVDRSQPLRANRIFPVGTLREPLAELRRCHMVILNGPYGRLAPDPKEAEVREFHPEARIFSCAQTIRYLIPFPSWREGRTAGDAGERPRSVYLVAAVGNPERFDRDVRQLGIEVRGMRFFADHYAPNPGEWRVCSREAHAKGAEALLITEKDAVKISRPPDFPLKVAVQETVLSDAGAFEQVLKRHVEERA